MAHEHNHTAEGLSENRLRLSLVLTFGFVLAETAFAVRSHSLALFSDAGHNFSDGFALLLSWYAIRVARKPATSGKTYGYHRVGILTALFNATTLLAIAAVIAVESIRRFAHPVPVESGSMIAVALAAVVINTAIALWLHSASHSSLNVRSAFVHMVGDAILSAAVVAAGVVLRLTGWPFIDPIVSILIAAFIVWSSVGIVRDAVNILLEGAPRGLDMKDLVSAMSDVSGVEDVHDLHVWTIGDGMNALSCHLRVTANDSGSAAVVVRDVKQMLASSYAVRHSTIETECTGCHTSDVYCQMEAHHPAGCTHDH